MWSYLSGKQTHKKKNTCNRIETHYNKDRNIMKFLL